MLMEKLSELVNELNRIHPLGFVDADVWKKSGVFPNFARAENGRERHFTAKAADALRSVASILYESGQHHTSFVIDHQEFHRLVRRCVVDLHAAGEMDASSQEALNTSRKKLREIIEIRLSETTFGRFHYFPAWTLGMEREQPYALGPVTIMTREHWISSIDFPQQLIDRYASTSEKNARWKTSLREMLQSYPQSQPPLSELGGLASSIYFAIRECPSIARVHIEGHEHRMSRKKGEIVVRSTLDSISLLFGGRDYFHQQAIHDQALPPFDSHTLSGVDNFIYLPGSSSGPRFRSIEHADVHRHLSGKAQYLEAIGGILTALVEPGSSRHPQLCNRWATALDWLGSGHRESSDAIAVAKIASCLDVLACGGKFHGVLAMLVNLLGVEEDEMVIHARSKTLKQVVKDIYDNGRSKILHGTEYDRINSFEAWRHYAATLARSALMESALRLRQFTGSEDDKTFRTIPNADPESRAVKDR